MSKDLDDVNDEVSKDSNENLLDPEIPSQTSENDKIEEKTPSQDTGKINLHDERLFELYVYARFFLNAIIVREKELYEHLSKIIVLTNYGKQILGDFLSTDKDLKREEVIPILFKTLFLKDLLIDHQKTDLEALNKIISTATIDRAIVFATKESKILYDKFNDAPYFEECEALGYELAVDLISGCGEGIFQIGHFTIGSFGIAKAEEIRFFPPSLKLPLWHCSDYGCEKLHEVRFDSVNDRLGNVENSFGHFIVSSKNEYNGDDKWTILKNGLTSLPSAGKRFSDLIPFIESCLSFEEKKKLFNKILKSKYFGPIKNLIEKKHISKEMTFENKINLLTSSELMACFTLCDDKFLVENLDRLIWDKEIYIPISELRTTKKRSRWSDGDAATEASCLGLRSNLEHPIQELTNLVWNAYEKFDREEDLKWKLGVLKGNSYKHAFLDKVNKEEPENIISTFILSTKDIADYIGVTLPQ